MPKIIITKPFRFAHHGYQIEEFTPAQSPVETSDECAAVALAEGWAKKPGKAAAAAPENKDAARQAGFELAAADPTPDTQPPQD